MDLENKKLQVDILGKKIEVLHKKILILLGGIAGSWFYGIDFSESEKVGGEILPAQVPKNYGRGFYYHK
jgi:hypothetical protein